MIEQFFRRITMKKISLLLAVSLLLVTGCNSDSSISVNQTPEDKDNPCGCKSKEVCAANGICYKDKGCLDCSADEVCVSGKCYANDSECGKCKADQVCQNDTCYDADNPCAKCKPKQVCLDEICYDADSPCTKCTDEEKCVGDVCYNKKNDVCAQCDPKQVCNKGKCYEADDPCAECKSEEVCEEGKCVIPADPCEACAPTDSCEDGECIPCKNEICLGVCCENAELCDQVTGECSLSCDETTPTCMNDCCENGLTCTEHGCDRICDSGSSCGPDKVCCTEEQECFGESHCVPKCDEPRVLCGEEGKEVCCEEKMVCLNNECHTDCAEDQTRCGADQNLCCKSDEICLFNKCLPKGASCKTSEECSLWEFCDTGSSTCVNQEEDKAKCIYRPPIGVFKPKVKWHYDDNVVSVPIVINLTDDNGDGKVDENDVPEVVFTNNSYYLTALSGDTGKPVAILKQPVFNAYNDIAAADVDNDGLIEVIVPTAVEDEATTGLYFLNLVKSGSGYEWKIKAFIHADNIDKSGRYWADLHPTVADIDADGIPEIITTRGVIKGNKLTEWSCKLNMQRVFVWYHDFFAVADLNQDKKMEIIADHIYDNKCQKIAANPEPSGAEGASDGAHWYYSAVADLMKDSADAAATGELVPEIVRVKSGYVSVWKVFFKDGKWSQKKAWEKPQTTTRGGGNPVIADFDGNGEPDIGVAGRTHYSVFNGQTGDIVWASPTIDASSEKTGSSVFDFEGDGVAEVVYRDETRLRIYSGKPDETKTIKADDGKEYKAGKILFETPNTSGTVIEYPLIVDVDNDGKTEIVMVSEVDAKYGDPNDPAYLGPEWTNLKTGITVFTDSWNNWVRTRRIWNQHAYHVTNINENGTVPKEEQANWLNKRLNNYRANAQPADVFNAPNFQPGTLKYDQKKCPDAITLTATVTNAGSLSVKNVWVSFYIKVDGKDELLGSVQYQGIIAPGASVEVSMDWNENTSDGKKKYNSPYQIFYKVDDAPGKDTSEFYNECIEDDNTSSATEVKACPEIVA